jgi:hypothetical protein
MKKKMKTKRKMGMGKGKWRVESVNKERTIRGDMK